MNRAWCLTFALLASTSYTQADGFDDEPYLLRLHLTLDRASNGIETIGRQASVAYAGGSAKNAAGLAVRPADRFATTHLSIFSQSHGHIMANAVTRTFALPSGNAYAALSRTDTPAGENTFGLDSPLRSNEIYLGLGKALGSRLALGVKGRIVDAHIRHESPDASLGGAPARLDVDVHQIDINAGLQYQVSPRIRMGFSGRIGYGDLDTEVRNLRALGGLPAGTLLRDEDGYLRSYAARTGLAYRLKAGAILFADLEHVGVKTADAGSAAVERLALGAEANTIDDLTIRGGWLIDSEEEHTISLGIAFAPTQHVQLDLAAQSNVAPEIEPEFGHADLLSLSLAIML